MGLLKKHLNKRDFMYYMKLSTYIYSQYDFHLGYMIYLKNLGLLFKIVINLNNQGLPTKELKKIGLILDYKIINI